MLHTELPDHAITLFGLGGPAPRSFISWRATAQSMLLCMHRGGWSCKLRYCHCRLSPKYAITRSMLSQPRGHNEHEGLDQAIESHSSWPLSTVRDAPGMLPAPLDRVRLGKCVEHFGRPLPDLFHPAALSSRQVRHRRAALSAGLGRRYRRHFDLENLVRSLEHAHSLVVITLGTSTCLRRRRRLRGIGCRVGILPCTSLGRAAGGAAVVGARVCLQGNNGGAEEGQRSGEGVREGRDPGLRGR